MKNKNTLLGSSPSLNDIKSLIARYWCTRTDSIALIKSGKINWKIYQNDVEMMEFVVTQKGLRFRFEHRGLA